VTEARLAVWPPLPPFAHLRGAAESVPFPLGEASCALFARARHGLWQGVQALGLEPGDEVLVPAYHHGSEVEALLGAGLVPRYYAGTESLEPDASELDALLGPRVRALHLTHYLGFPQDAGRWAGWCRERGLLLLEDAAQAWLAFDGERPVGSMGDLAVFCLYKTVGVPDGSAMLVRAPAPGPETARGLGLAGVARRHTLWAMQHSKGLSALAARTRTRGEYLPDADFALGHPGVPPSSVTLRLLPRLADPAVASRRRANYAQLLDDVRDVVPAPFDELAAGASPFAMPIATADKAKLLGRLSEAGIAALDLWSVPHPSLPAERFEAAGRRRATTVAVPVHQELRPADLERIATAISGPRRWRTELRLEEVGSLDALHDEWSALAERTENIFATWEWAETWWRHFGDGRPLHVIACRSGDGRLRAILPLYRYAGRPLHIVRFIGHGPADQLGPICAPADRPAAARALRRALADLRPELFLGEHLSRDEGWSALCGGRVLMSQGAPVVRFDGASWDEVLASRSANLRQQVRRLERKLQRDHGLGYRLVGAPDELEGDMDRLFALHAARWSEGESDFTGGHVDFHRDFASQALERGWLRLWFLEADGRTVAAWHGFRFGSVESYYQAGRDPQWEGPSVGFVLLAHSIRAAADDGMREYRFLRGEQGFKYRFANADPGVETIGVARGPVGHAALTAGVALPDPLVSPLRRRLG
jgi:dTDP-4-amino-4,6-dideoxygalactose transaminase/CelD/BcsL family acetyltransferase involved in cellulose biosynthesis